jgi:heavy metal sensor kinase
MQLSLRTRLTAWYSMVLVLTVAVFSIVVLWAHWRLLVRQFDETLESIGDTADNVIKEEFGEGHDLARAASETAALVRPSDGAVEILDASGTPIHPTTRLTVPLFTEGRSVELAPGTRSLKGPDGRLWRVRATAGTAGEQRYLVVAGAPLDAAIEQWRLLLKACLVGIPLALAFAAGGGWWLGRHGLRPLTSMAEEAQAITAANPETRLTVPGDIDELRQLAGSFNHVLDRLGSALSTQRRFMADASHELRTPVSIMRTAAEVTLIGTERSEGDYREALGVVAQQGARLTRLVNDMLALARADGGGYPVVMAAVDLHDVVTGCIQDLAPRAAEQRIEIRPRLAPVVFNGDEALLRRLCSNLLDNALRHTPAAGRVTVTLEQRVGQVVLSVADTGPGIPVEDHERVFERFVRLDPSRRAGGVGLGLAIVRWVADVHHGTVRIVSESGPGCTVVATFPTASSQLAASKFAVAES